MFSQFFYIKILLNIILKSLVTASSLQFHLILTPLFQFSSLLFLLYRCNPFSNAFSCVALYPWNSSSSTEKCSFVGRIHPRIANGEPFSSNMKISLNFQSERFEKYTCVWRNACGLIDYFVPLIHRMEIVCGNSLNRAKNRDKYHWDQIIEMILKKVINEDHRFHHRMDAIWCRWATTSGILN